MGSDYTMGKILVSRWYSVSCGAGRGAPR